MKTNQPRTGGIKFAEAAVLFVLILGLTVFVGIRMASHGDEQKSISTTAPVVTQQEQSPAPVAAAVDSTPAPEVATIIPESATEPKVETKEIAAVQEPISASAAVAAYSQGDYDEAVDLLTTYADQNPASAWAQYMLGLALVKAGDPEGADDSFKAALDLKPDYVKCMVNDGRALLAMDRAQDALQMLENATGIDPDNAQAWRVLARAQNNLGQHEAAENTYRKILTNHPDDVWSLNNLGLLLIQEGRFPEALPPLSRAVQINPQLACVQNNFGTALERNGFIAAAKDAYARTVALDSAYTKAKVSVTRLEPIIEAEGLEPFDLAATANNFRAQPAQIPATVPSDLEIAAATTATPTATTAKPEQTTIKNR